jgi:hypothetical protein
MKYIPTGKCEMSILCEDRSSPIPTDITSNPSISNICTFETSEVLKTSEVWNEKGLFVKLFPHSYILNILIPFSYQVHQFYFGNNLFYQDILLIIPDKRLSLRLRLLAELISLQLFQLPQQRTYGGLLSEIFQV